MNYEASHYVFFFLSCHFLLHPNILLSILFSNIICANTLGWVSKFHTYTQREAKLAFFTLIFTFLDKMTEDSELVETFVNYMLISQFQEN